VTSKQSMLKSCRHPLLVSLSPGQCALTCTSSLCFPHRHANWCSAPGAVSSASCKSHALEWDTYFSHSPFSDERLSLTLLHENTHHFADDIPNLYSYLFVFSTFLRPNSNVHEAVPSHRWSKMSCMRAISCCLVCTYFFFTSTLS